MSINTFMKIGGALAMLFRIGWLLAPEFMAKTYGIVPNAAAVLPTRFLGLTSIGWGLVGWLASHSSDWTALRGAFIGNAAGLILGVLVSVWYTVNGPLNAMGWSAVVIYGVFFLGSVYYPTTGPAVAKLA